MNQSWRFEKMKEAVPYLLLVLFAACAQDSDTKGIAYSGKADLNNKLHEFTAVNPDSKRDIVLTKTGPHELTFKFNDKLTHIDYEDDIIIVQSEMGLEEWTAKRVNGGFELQDGTVLEFGKCKDWTMCLIDGSTKEPLLKGRYVLRGSNVTLTLWISEKEMHMELLGLMANGLFNKSRNAKESDEAAIEILSTQVWTY